jgi:hypothetical protein
MVDARGGGRRWERPRLRLARAAPGKGEAEASHRARPQRMHVAAPGCCVALCYDPTMEPALCRWATAPHNATTTHYKTLHEFR